VEAINMALKEQIEHAAAVTKWKADQQMRILKIQGQISDMESTIKGRVYALGESTLRLSEQGELRQASLLELTYQISSLKEQLVGLQQSLTAVKTESGPQRPQPQQSYSGLVCPECGEMLKGNFCPVHGVAGVLPAAPEPTTPVPSDGYLACPVCNQPLNGKFCPIHGAEGVWVEPTPQAYSSPEPWSNPNPESLPGFQSSESQPTSWSSYDPVPPEIPQPDQNERLNHDDL
jgi:RNA polymerase subunit RPABC4/transcription elongation factor Spt4